MKSSSRRSRAGTGRGIPPTRPRRLRGLATHWGGQRCVETRNPSGDKWSHFSIKEEAAVAHTGRLGSEVTGRCTNRQWRVERPLLATPSKSGSDVCCLPHLNVAAVMVQECVAHHPAAIPYPHPPVWLCFYSYILFLTNIISCSEAVIKTSQCFQTLPF